MSSQTILLNPHEDQNRDLGFGSVISRESNLRLLNRDGSFNVKRQGATFWSTVSSYHFLLTMPWWKFISLFTLFYVAMNAVFAEAYLLAGPQALAKTIGGVGGHSFMDAFFFSVQTFSTIGYGHIAPNGLAANLIVTVESLAGLLAFTLATGVIFARFSRPTANILYSKLAVIAPYHDITAFEFRVTNARNNQLIELEAKVIYSRFENEKGGRLRRYYPLKLERQKVAFFPLSWTIVHPIDDDSPLKGMTQSEMLASQGEFLILLTGIDETFSQTVHSRSSYTAEEVRWNSRFISLFKTSDGTLSIDLEKFDATEPAERLALNSVS